MLARIPRESLQRFRKIDDGLDFLVLAVHTSELFIVVQRLIECHANLEGHLFCDLVDEPIGLAQYTTDITDNSTRCHRAIGDYLRHLVATITFRDILDHPVPAFHAEVHIEIRHRDTLGIQEALEQQLVT